MKTRSLALAAHQALGTTTLARCWRFERKDGEVRTVTSCARNLLISGELYLSRDGVNPTAIEQSANASVANSEVTGTLSPDLVTETEMLAAKWDAAKVVIFEVNYRDLTMGAMVLQAGTVGDIKVGRVIFNGEVRGLAQALQQTVGYLYTKNCQAQLGDENCTVDLGPFTETGTLTGVTDRRVFEDSARIEADDWYGAGLITFDDGLNEGVSMEIYSFAAGVFALHLPVPFNLAIGDAYTVVPGCRKRHSRSITNPSGVSDCKDKFNNIVNFYLGFPFVPGSDKVLGLGGTTGTNL